MARIIDMINQRKQEFRDNPVLASQNMTMALAAIREGINSKAWEYYMSQYVERNAPGELNQEQLARLMATDGTVGDPIMDRHRAYLVANAVCGPSTEENLHFGIESIDNGLATAQCARELLGCETTILGANRGRKRPGPKKAGKKKAGKKKGWGG